MPDSSKTNRILRGILISPWFSLGFVLLSISFFDRLANGFTWPVRIFAICGFFWIVYSLVRQFVRLWNKKKVLAVFAFILMVFYYAIFEFGCLVFDKTIVANDEIYVEDKTLALSERSRESLKRLVSGERGFYQIDPLMGWSIQTTGNNHGTYQANSDGIRATQNYDKARAAGITRISCCGDSYTFGSEVKNGETWPAYLQDTLGKDHEVINFGMPGTGLTQSYLRYKNKAEAYESDIVIIGFMSNNIERTLNTFRPFLIPETGFPLAKPYAALNGDGELIFHPPLLKNKEDYINLLANTDSVLLNIAEKDYYFRDRISSQVPAKLPSQRVWAYLNSRTKVGDNVESILKKFLPRKKKRASYYDPDGYALKVVEPLFEKYVSAVQSAGAKPIVVIFPNGPDIVASNNGKPVRYGILKKILAKQGVKTIDILDLFVDTYGKTIPKEKIFRKVHYNPETNLLVAEYIAECINNIEKQSTGSK